MISKVSNGIFVFLASVVVGACVLLVFLIKKVFGSSSSKRNTRVPSFSDIRYTNTPVDYAEATFSTYIAGAAYHCSEADLTFFTGFAINDSSNRYNGNAIGIYRNDGHLLGYVAEKELSSYWEWSRGEMVPCVGYLKRKEDGGIHSNVKMMHAYSPVFVAKEIAAYKDWWDEQNR